MLQENIGLEYALLGRIAALASDSGLLLHTE